MVHRRVFHILFWLGALGLAVPNVATNAQTTVSSPYAKWFFSPRDSSSDELMFRMFGYEGMARNLFVLYCKKDHEAVTVELIPPKALEERLRKSASAKFKPTTVKFLDSQNTAVFQERGEYDKIAAFIDFFSGERLFKFLQLFQNDKLLVRWDRAGIEYLLWANNVDDEQFITIFRPQFRERYEEISYQEVYVRCGRLWGG
jgi:hypothetical protein